MRQLLVSPSARIRIQPCYIHPTLQSLQSSVALSVVSQHELLQTLGKPLWLLERKTVSTFLEDL